MLHYIRMFCGDMELLILAMNRKIPRKFGKSTEKCRKTETWIFRKKERIESKKKKKESMARSIIQWYMK